MENGIELLEKLERNGLTLKEQVAYLMKNGYSEDKSVKILLKFMKIHAVPVYREDGCLNEISRKSSINKEYICNDCSVIEELKKAREMTDAQFEECIKALENSNSAD